VIKWVLQAISHGIEAVTIARLYRKHWRIQGMFPRLELVLQSEIKCLGHPRAALLGFVAAVMAYNVLALLKQVIEQAHEATHSELDVSILSPDGGDQPWL
jgi:IS4 transposase